MAYKPTYKEIPYHNPVALFQNVAHDTYALLMHSSVVSTECGRYSYICWDPQRVILTKGNLNYMDGVPTLGNPFDALGTMISDYSLSTNPDLPPFQTGAAGLFGYDLCQQLETLDAPVNDELQFYDMYMGVYDTIIAFDHIKRQAWIISSGYPERDEELRQTRIKARIKQFSDKLATPVVSNIDTMPNFNKTLIQSNFTESGYHQAIEKIKEYILAGDVFQVNLTQRFQCYLDDPMDYYDLFKRIINLNPAPFAAYVNLDNYFLVSVSPERFIKLTDKKVQTRPIKGTMPRYPDPVQDEQAAYVLQNSSKDRSENIMIVDLMRNDLSRVCKPASIHVPHLCQLESHETVHHLVSVLEGELKDDYTAIDLLKASFPGGSITGAPKVRAMEIIYELEGTKRGPYCGSVGFISFNGNMDTSIAIRTYCIRDNYVTFQAGGAIVLDSDPAMEYQESLNKVRALRRALTDINQSVTICHGLESFTAQHNKKEKG